MNRRAWQSRQCDGEFAEQRAIRILQFNNVLPLTFRHIVQGHEHQVGTSCRTDMHNNVTGIAYPGKIGNTQWNRDQLRRVLQPVREFQLAYNVHIYVGEFSAIRWAPGAVDYLRDCIELFEEYGWDWTYHAYREWDGWSVEHGDDRKNGQPAKEPTDRMQLLRSWFARNKKPQ